MNTNQFRSENTNYSISDYLEINEDEYRPQIPNPLSQQIDPYSIYDLVCIDYEYELITNKPGTVNQPPQEKQIAYLAIQAYSPCVIPFNYSEIIKDFV